MLIPVVLAGGSGTRLWPLSRAALPKPFVTLPGRERSLFQETLLRLGGIAGAPLVVCNEQHRFLAAEQLRQTGIANARIANARILLEPASRNTAAAAALASLAALQTDAKATLLVLASDHLIDQPERLLEAVREAEGFARNGHLATFGVVPDSPATGFGYIAVGKRPGETRACVIDRFVEKPDLATAEGYLAAGGHLWNSGMSLFRADVFLRELKRYDANIYSACELTSEKASHDADFIRFPSNPFSACPNRSIEHAVMEHTEKGIVVPLVGSGWSDLGTWEAVWRHAPQDEQGNAISGDVVARDVHGCHIDAGSRLIAALGLRDLVIVDTEDALLVAECGESWRVGEIVRELVDAARPEVQDHRLVKRPWGSYQSLFQRPGFQVKHLVVNPGEALSLQKHAHRDEHWTVVRGCGIVTCGEREFALGVNESTVIPRQSKHRLRNDSADEPVEIIEVQLGGYLGEDDIIRYDDRYGRSS